MKVLVIDDDVLFCRIIKQTLQLEGCSVVEAYDGKDAIKKLKDNQFDIVITDIIMPGVDGITVGEFIKDNGICSAVMAISSDKGENSILSFAEYYVDCTLKKPFNKDEFLQAFKGLMGGINIENALQNM